MSSRVLTIMGSGETSPTMVKVHRRVLEGLGPLPVPAVMLDTPFGFQENAGELCGRTILYFDESLHTLIQVASFRSDREIGTRSYDECLAALRSAAYVFAGPGSPTYALRCWRASLIPALLTEKLSTAGAVTFASAAACTLGAWAVPVYEIYKVGADPEWLQGIDLVSPAIGARVAVIPHFDNAEGGTHDTRYCYLGERRLSLLEEMLPDEGFILGVDEHTALVLDLDHGTATTMGNGTVTVRTRGRSSVISSGQSIPIARLGELAAELREGVTHHAGPTRDPEPDIASPNVGSPFVDAVSTCESTFDAAIGKLDVEAAVDALLDLDHLLVQWANETFSSDERERAHTVLRGMILSLGRLAEKGAVDRREVVGPYVDALVKERDEARAEGRFADADRLRDRLVAAGIEVRDTPQGSEWEVRS